MANADLGACEWFIYELRRSSLIDRGQLDSVVGDFLKRNPRADPPALAEYLVQQGILSNFQAERILQGKTQGLVLGPYNLMDAIGTGSMGQVYKALSKTDNQWYAVKVLPRRSMWNVRLARRQVRSFGQFQHPAVVPFVDVGTSGGMHYLVWPLVEGETLEAVVRREGKLTAEQTALVSLQIGQGLAVCHQQNLFHGLLKPSNIMMGADRQARILDFGIGSLLVENEGESLVDTMSTANTFTSGLDCASPESIMEPTNRTLAGDQYSLGCTMYYCLAGRFPFPEGSAVEKMMAHQFRQPTPLKELVPDAPDALVAVIDKLMSKAPDARYAGMDEFLEALQPLVPASMVASGPTTRMPVGVPPTRGSGSGARPAPPRLAPSRPADQVMPMPPSVSASATPAPAPMPARVPGRADFAGGSGTAPPPTPPAPAPAPLLPPRTRSQVDIVFQPPPVEQQQYAGGGESGEEDDRIVIGPVGMAAVTVLVTFAVYAVGYLLMR